MTERHPEWEACRQRTPEERQAVHAATARRSFNKIVGWPLTGRNKQETTDNSRR